MEAKNNSKIQGSVIIVGIIGLVLGFLVGWLVGQGNSGPVPANNRDTSEEAMEESDESMVDDEGEMMTGDNEAIRNPLQDGVTTGGSVLDVDTNAANFSVSDQSAGSVVMVEGVSADTVTWVAVRESDNGKLGNILGARRIDEGNNQNVEVRLLRPTVSGSNYFVVLFEDNGDKTFNHDQDMQVVVGGKVVAAEFAAQ